MSDLGNCSHSASSNKQEQQQQQEQQPNRRKSSTVESAKGAKSGSSDWKNGADALNDSMFDSGPPCAKNSESLACRFHLPSWKRCFTKKGLSDCHCDGTPQKERHAADSTKREEEPAANCAMAAVPPSTAPLSKCNSAGTCSANCPSSVVNNIDGSIGTGNIRKTSFKITSVREKTGSESEDDDTAGSDNEPQFLRQALAVNGMPPPGAAAQKVTPTAGGRPSRFHIVTVSGRPYKRDRWLCQDIEPIPEESNGNDSGRFAASAATTATATAPKDDEEDRGKLLANRNDTPKRKFAITKVPEAIVRSPPIPSTSFASSCNSTAAYMSNPLPKQTSGAHVHGRQSGLTGGEIAGAKDTFPSMEPSAVGGKANCDVGSLPLPTPLQDVRASGMDGRPSSAGSLNGDKAQSIEIDGKIDKAMDLVKVHLLYAVRTEVKQLKEEIDRLNKELSYLKMENNILRRHVPLEVIAVLSRTARARAGKVPPEN
uniref:4Fe-4S ferredoxin-type domain-containing protein n=1 Tax=Trichuris muris TaxID=70415 RepID=A0A5S6Q6N3_TRIMR